MRRLYMQIAGGVILAVIVGWTAVGLFIPRMRSMMEQGLADQLLGSGLRAVGARLDATSPDQWDAQLAQVRREITIPLAIVRNEDLPDGSPASRLQPTIVHPGGADLASIYIPMANRTHVIVAGPLEQPPVAPLVAVAIVFVFVLTVTASAFVGVPLVRRLRKVSSVLAESRRRQLGHTPRRQRRGRAQRTGRERQRDGRAAARTIPGTGVVAAGRVP